MSSSIKRFALTLALLAAPAWAQETPAPEDGNPGAERAQPASPKKGTEKHAAAGAEDKGTSKVVGARGEDEVKVLQPKDVPNELLRLRSKADIKAEVTVKPLHGQAVVFKGVVRNGKLIERFKERSFVPLKDIEHTHSGVRLWWIGGSDGWMFFRYSNIQSIALTGRLTAEERREILRKLRAKKEKDPAKPADTAALLASKLEELTEEELDTYLVTHYPPEKGWDQQKLRALKKKAIIDNEPLDREESIFVEYYTTLRKARLKALKQAQKKSEIEIEPGSEEQPEHADGAPGSVPGR